VRADITPQVARIDAHRLKGKVPTRLCYIGQVLHTHPEGFTRNRSPFQVGAELYGHSGSEADVEILQLMVETLKVAGLVRPHIDIGHVGIFRGLAKEAGISEEQEQILFGALQRKMKPEIVTYLSGLEIKDKYRQMFAALVDLWGGEEVLQEAHRALEGAGLRVRQALANLENIAILAQRRMPNMHLHFDLADLRGYHYQTGLVFAVFVAGHGEEIARGGRYDDIGRVFGAARPATGFSTDLETLLMLSPESINRVRGIYAPAQESAW
jgi:ATP phosphoribosyltransferase regulatory subunit